MTSPLTLAERVRGLTVAETEAAIKVMAQAMLNSKAWPAVFKAGTAEELACAALLALAGRPGNG